MKRRGFLAALAGFVTAGAVPVTAKARPCLTVNLMPDVIRQVVADSATGPAAWTSTEIIALQPQKPWIGDASQFREIEPL